VHGVHCDAGSISAWAEEPVLSSSNTAISRVDLRVGGGTLIAIPQRPSSPGRSPRGRRNLVERRIECLLRGSISAWAEEPRQRRRPHCSMRVDLRVGGGTVDRALRKRANKGRSPRGRRNPVAAAADGAGAGSISAWAEEPSTP